MRFLKHSTTGQQNSTSGQENSTLCQQKLRIFQIFKKFENLDKGQKNRKFSLQKIEFSQAFNAWSTKFNVRSSKDPTSALQKSKTSKKSKFFQHFKKSMILKKMEIKKNHKNRKFSKIFIQRNSG